MSDYGKQFEPTPSRLRKARAQGDAARSQDLVSACAFAGAIAACIIARSQIVVQANAALHSAFRGAIDARALLAVAAWSLLPCIGAAVAAAGAGYAQTGGLQFRAPVLHFSRIDPVQGTKRLFSREILSVMLRSVAVACASLAVVVALFGHLARSGIPESAGALAVMMISGAMLLCGALAAVGISAGACDFALVYRRWRSKLRMSLEEFKRDLKDSDGDPFARSRRRAMHRSMSRGSIEEVKKAAFVLVNPQHVAVACEYRAPEVPVPRVLVRAADAMAQRVKARAHALGVPVVENVALARELFATARVGEAIPRALYVAIAEVVAALSCREAISR